MAGGELPEGGRHCSACGRVLPPGAQFCDSCGAGAPTPASADAEAPLRELPLGERRHATALFSDLTDYTALNERLDPEEVAGVMNRLKQSAARIIEDYGGTVNQFVGDEVMGLFGVPKSHGDDPVRAVRAALELHRFVRELGDKLAPFLGQALRLHTALDMGLMVTQVRDGRDGLYGVTGEVINTCSHLAAAAGADEIFVTPAVHRQIRDYFETESVGPIALHGKTEVLTVHRVQRAVASSGFDAAQRRGLTEFTDRSEEIELLCRCLDDARGGRARFVAIAGEPGMGKSRLFHEFRRCVAEDVWVLHGRCPSAGVVAPYEPLRDALRRALVPGDDADLAVERIQKSALIPDEQIPFLLALLSLHSERRPLPRELFGDPLREAILAMLSALLAKLAQQRPLVLLLEDWHWADPASETALERIAEHLGPERLLILVNYRPHYQSEWKMPDAITLELAPLGADDSRHIVDRLLGADSPGGLVDHIYERSAGNPLFIEEVCHSILESSTMAGNGDAARELSVPDSVEAVVQARIDWLDADSAETLKLAAVIGGEFSRDLLERIGTAPERIDAALDRLIEAGLVRVVLAPDEKTYRFKHAIVHDVAYETLLRRRRRDLHAAAGRAIEELRADRLQDYFEILAHHYMRSDERLKAVFYLDKSGDKATQSGAMLQARDNYREAVRILDELEPTPENMTRRISISLKLANAAIYRPSSDSLEIMKTSHEQALRLGDEKSATRSLYWIGWVELALGRWSDAIPHFQRCIDLVDQSGDRKLLAQLYSNLGQCLCHGGDYPRATEHLERAIALRSSISGGASRVPLIAYSMGYLAMIDAETGKPARALERLEVAEAMVEGRGQLELESAILSLRVFVELYRGDWTACQAHAELLLPRAARIGSTYMRALSLTNGGYARFFQGDREGGLGLLREGLDVLVRDEVLMNRSWACALLAEALALVGDLDEAEGLAEQALERCKQGDRFGEVAAHRALLLIAAGRSPGDDARVDGALDRALASARQKGATSEEGIVRLRAVEALREARSPAWQRKMLDECAKSFAAMEMPWYRERAEALLAELPAG